MELSNATLDELLTLKLAVCIAYERVKDSQSEIDHTYNLRLWESRIREAELDIMFEQTKLS